MSKPLYPSEEQLLGSIASPTGRARHQDDSHHETRDNDPLELVFAYRAFEPLGTFRQALECLQSECAYAPEGARRNHCLPARPQDHS